MTRSSLLSSAERCRATLAPHPHRWRDHIRAPALKTARDRLVDAHALFAMERVKGIEPSFQAWEAHVLPLNHTRVPPATFFPFNDFSRFVQQVIEGGDKILEFCRAGIVLSRHEPTPLPPERFQILPHLHRPRGARAGWPRRGGRAESRGDPRLFWHVYRQEE